FPVRIPVPTLPPYPVRFPETTLYHWGKPLANASSLTGTNAVPVVANGPSQFGEAVEIRDWDKEREIPMKDVYLKYYTRSSNANYARETLVSTGGDKQGHPGIHLWWEGPFIGVLVSTGAQYWESVFLPSLYNDTWNNIAFRWLRPQGSEKGKLEVLINVEQQAAVNFPTNAVGGTAKKALLPPTLMLGCHRDSGSSAGTLFGGGFFDEIAFWDTFMILLFSRYKRPPMALNKEKFFTTDTYWIYGETHKNRESSSLNDEMSREVAWIAVESIVGEANLTSEPVKPSDATLGKTGATPDQQVESLINFVTALQSPAYNYDNKSAMFAGGYLPELAGIPTSVILNSIRESSSLNDEMSREVAWIAVESIVGEANLTSEPVKPSVSKFGVARIGYLAKSPPIVFPNYSDTIWDKGLKEKFEYPSDSIEGNLFMKVRTIERGPAILDSNIQSFKFDLNKNAPKAQQTNCKVDEYAMMANPIKIRFAHKMVESAQTMNLRKLLFHKEEFVPNIRVRHCVWWNPNMHEFGGWDTTGCVTAETSDNYTVCECAKQGQFGVLGEMIVHYHLPTEPTWLIVVKFVGYALSIICLPIFIIIVIKAKEHLHDQFHIMRAHLAFALFVGMVLHVVSDFNFIRSDRHACTAISVLFHYFYTAAASWFCFESFASFMAITQGVIGGKLRAYMFLCWGIPFLSVGYALFQDMLNYGNDPRCMISFDNDMKWVFFGPLLTLASVGFLFCAIVVCNVSTPALRKDHIAEELSSVGQGLAVQTTYFLVTWIAGVCGYFIYDWTVETPGFYALFQVLNAYTKKMIMQYLRNSNQHGKLPPQRQKSEEWDPMEEAMKNANAPPSGRAKRIVTST
ncbi:unnamed protein product, partial [Notodromas monacha]